MSSAVADARRLVIKVRSALVTNEGRGLDLAAIERWAEQISRLHALGKQVLLVSSGAIAEGMQRLGWATRPQQVHELHIEVTISTNNVRNKDSNASPSIRILGQKCFFGRDPFSQIRHKIH